MASITFRSPFVPITYNGVPVSGALLYFYLTETLTLSPVYSDSDLTIPRTNPVECDSSGMPPNIYLDSAVTYRLRVHDADDVFLYEVDPYQSADATELLTLIKGVDGTGSGLDADTWRGVTPHRALLVKSANESVNAVAGVNITWNTETYDTDTFHSTSSNTERLTVQEDGYARVAAQISISSVANNEWVRATITKNGAANYPGIGIQMGFTDASTALNLNLSTAVIPVVAGDYFVVNLVTESDTSVAVNGDDKQSWFGIEMVAH